MKCRLCRLYNGCECKRETLKDVLNQMKERWDLDDLQEWIDKELGKK